MSISVFKNKKLETSYKIRREPQNRNPCYKLILNHGILCKYCVRDRDCKGRKRYFRSLNKLHGHLSYNHGLEDFKEYLMSLADLVISGDLQ